MEFSPLHEALRLIKRQTELENAMRRPGGIRVTEESELFRLHHALNQFPAAVTAIVEAAERMRRPVDTISLYDVERMGEIYSHSNIGVTSMCGSATQFQQDAQSERPQRGSPFENGF